MIAFNERTFIQSTNSSRVNQMGIKPIQAPTIDYAHDCTTTTTTTAAPTTTTTTTTTTPAP